MATSNKNSFPILLSISITFFVLLLNKVNSTETFSFSFSRFEPNERTLVLQGDASIPLTGDGQLLLTKIGTGNTPEPHTVGQVRHISPVHIWDSTTNTVANFKTSFSFIIKAPDVAATADGLAFFLAPEGIQPQSPGGGLFGLFKDPVKDNTKIVAVEFDTYLNDWDPCSKHIGIDINSIHSNKNVTWVFVNNTIANVEIKYDASTQTLSASLSYPSIKKSYNVHEIVELKDVLPEWVNVGFSAASGDLVETHDLLSWSFESTVPGGKTDAWKKKVYRSSYMLLDSM